MYEDDVKISLFCVLRERDVMRFLEASGKGNNCVIISVALFVEVVGSERDSVEVWLAES